jgi:hypothetical protein
VSSALLRRWSSVRRFRIRGQTPAEWPAFSHYQPQPDFHLRHNPRIGRQPQPPQQCIRQRTLRRRCCLSARRIQSYGLKQIFCRTQLAAHGLLDHCRQNIFRSAFHRDIFWHFHEIDRLQPFSCGPLRTFFCRTFFISPLRLRVGLRFSLSLRPSSSPCLTCSFVHAPPHTSKAKATLNVRRLRARYSRENKSAMGHFRISVQKHEGRTLQRALHRYTKEDV